MIQVKTHLKAMNKALDAYADKFKKDSNKLIKWVSVGCIKDIAKANPVDTGRSKAAWLPYLWAQNVSIKAPAKTAKTPNVTHAAVNEGVQQGTFGFDTHKAAKPYAWVQNNVHYVKYLEYGVKKWKSSGRSGGSYLDDTLEAVSKKHDKGFVRGAVKAWHKKLKQAIKTGVIPKGL